MALDDNSMTTDAIAKLQAKGFEINEHSRFSEMVEVIMETVVTHLKANAEVTVVGGGSYGGEIAKIN